MPASTSADQLCRTSLGRGLTPAQAHSLLAIADESDLEAGTTVFRESDPGDCVYLVLDGRVQVLKKDKQGTEHPLAELEPGTVLGEMSLVAGNAPRSATARAMTKAKLLRLPTDRFQGLLSRDDLAALKVVRNIAEEMGRRLLVMNERIVETLSRAAAGRREELGNFSKLLHDWSF